MTNYTISVKLSLSRVIGYSGDQVAKFEASLDVPEASLAAINAQGLDSLSSLVKGPMLNAIREELARIEQDRQEAAKAANEASASVAQPEAVAQ
jgi:hypothetical protein